MIVNNRALSAGGGLYDCHGTIRSNTISGNSADCGGGLYDCDGTIQNNTICNNTASYGGGLDDCDGTIQNNTISSNAADKSGGGLCRCDGKIENNVICNNTAHTAGAGLVWCNGTIQNNTVSSNTAGGSGGGLYRCDGTIRNSIIWQNTASAGAQLYGGLTPSYSCIQDWPGGGKGNTSEDPQLVDPANGDFHLLPSSPCIDAGGTVSLTVDFDGDPRPIDSIDLLRGDGSDFDIGADEAGPTVILTTAAGPFEGGRVVPTGRTRYFTGTTVTVTAIPNCGWAFDRWSGDVAGTTNPIAIVMDTTKTVTAHFVAIPGPDLEGRLDGVSPNTIIARRPVSLQGQISNVGDAATTPAFWVEFWVHNRQTGWSGYLCDSIALGPLAAGAAFDLSASAPPRVAYADIPAGLYAIEMRIDALNEVVESCETNNVAHWEPCVILPDQPNLVVEGFDFAPEDMGTTGGDAIGFSGMIRNTGSQPTSGSFWIEFHVSRELPFPFADDYLCDSHKITMPMAPGQAIDLASLPPRAAYPLAPGVYYVGVRLDPLDEIAEQREDDNATWVVRKKLYVGPRPTGVRSWTQYR